jgi:alpha-ketoglutarate-dependent taurine dioxygenase
MCSISVGIEAPRLSDAIRARFDSAIHSEPVVTSENFPYVFGAKNQETNRLADFWSAHSAQIDAVLLEHGAILFKGFHIDTAEKFNGFMGGLPLALGNYVDGNSPRTKLSSTVYTSTEYPAELPISLHNELSYSDVWPARLYFCCVVAAITGGSTTIADSRQILADLPRDIVEEYERKGVMYVRNLQGGDGLGVGKSWQQTFETTSRADVEAHCGVRNIKYEWLPNDALRLIQIRPGLAQHPQSGAKVWFNQADQFHPSTNPPEVYEALLELYEDSPFDMPQYSCFGDGTPIPDDMLAQVRAVMVRREIAFPWEVGDLMVVDNMLSAHGRSPYSGARKVLVSMSGY